MPPEEAVSPITDKDQLISALDRALQEEDLVLIRETDLDVLHRYLANTLVGVLHVSMPDETNGIFDIVFSILETGEYIFPWRYESVEDILANGKTYLAVNDKKIYFSSVRELFFGDHKAFVVCTPSPHEVSDGQHDSAVDAPSK